jgi:carbamoyltransferase
MIANWALKGDPKKFYNLIASELIDIGFPKITINKNLHRGCKWWHPELSSEQDLYDIAAATQKIFEDSVSMLSRWAQIKTGSQHLALAGGGAMNKVAVNLIRPNWNSVWVPPNPGDSGSCIGAVLAKTKTFTFVDNIWYKAV